MDFDILMTAFSYKSTVVIMCVFPNNNLGDIVGQVINSMLVQLDSYKDKSNSYCRFIATCIVV